MDAQGQEVAWFALWPVIKKHVGAGQLAARIHMDFNQGLVFDAGLQVAFGHVVDQVAALLQALPLVALLLGIEDFLEREVEIFLF